MTNTQQNQLVAKAVSKRYKSIEALKPTDLVIEPGKIYGLIGRNGAGKTTLLSVLTAQNPATSGEVTYNGESVWENRHAIGEICFSRELSPMMLTGSNNYKGKQYLAFARCYYPHWDEAYAQRLVKAFEFDTKKKVHQMSKGMTSMLTIILAMASRAPITIMDEPVAGLDVSMRDRFYRILLDDYEKTGRTFVISTHIIEEAASIFEEIILLDKGSIIEKINTEQYLSQFRYLSGRDETVDAAACGFEVLHSEGIGRQKTVCVRGEASEIAAAAGRDIDVSAVPLHKVFVYVTGGEREENLA